VAPTVWRVYRSHNPGVDAWQEFIELAGSADAAEAAVKIRHNAIYVDKEHVTCRSGLLRVFHVQCEQATYGVFYGTEASDDGDVGLIVATFKGLVAPWEVMDVACERLDRLPPYRPSVEFS